MKYLVLLFVSMVLGTTYAQPVPMGQTLIGESGRAYKYFFNGDKVETDCTFAKVNTEVLTDNLGSYDLYQVKCQKDENEITDDNNDAGVISFFVRVGKIISENPNGLRR